MALNELHEGRGIPNEWYSEESKREARWLLPFARRIAESLHVRGGANAGRPAMQLSEACAEALDALEKRKVNPGFLHASEMEDWTWEVREASDGQEGWRELSEFAEKLPVLLLRPLTRFVVSFDFEPVHRFYSQHGYRYIASHPLGGPREIVFVPKLRDDKFVGLTVNAVVRAGTIDGAVRRTEWLIDELCGALRAVGLARFVQLPGRGMKEFFGTVSLPAAHITGGKWGGEPYDLDPSAVLRLSGLVLTIPGDLGELMRARVAGGDLDAALGFHHRLLKRVMAGTSLRAAELRGACRRLVQAEFASEFGLAVTLAFSALEGLLLEPSNKDEVVGRLSEAVAHGIGRSIEDRAALRKRAKMLYAVRSTFVHTGTVRTAERERAEAEALGYRVLRREIELLEQEAEET